MWLDIDYKNRELVADEAVVRMLAAIRTTIFHEGTPSTLEGYKTALAQLRQIMAANRGDKTLFEQAGYSLDEAVQILQMLAATED